jgi:tRNA A-37 threonylcarbamoyl transferase component Bud32
MPEWIGKTIGNVRIEKYLARGGMAEVYLGIHQTLDRPVAVKVLHAFIEEDPDLLKRFQREAKVVAGLRHPNIVQVFDFDTVENHPYIVMEYLKGPSLATYLKSLHERSERIPTQQVAHLLKLLASALDYAHGQGVIHRDIKPGNILFHSKTNEVSLDHPLPEDADVVLTDFGLVRIAHSATQTASGLISGTPAYMAPEQARGDKVDYRADIYSLGVVLYEMLAGRVPFEGDSTLTVIYKQINEPPPPIEGIPAAVQAVIDCALAKRPEDRYRSARDLALDFSEAIGQNADEETLRPAPTPTHRSAEAPKKRNPALGPILIGGAVLVCGCLAVALLGGLGMSFLPIISSMTVTATQPPVAIVATETVAPPTPKKEDMAMQMPTEVGSLGILRFQDGAAKLDQITISATLAPPASGRQYEAWLISDSGEQRRSLGVLAQNASGQFTLTYVDPQSRNMLDGFGSMEITLEPNPDDSPNPTTDVAYSSAIPKGSLMHIRHLLVRMVDNPNHIGMVVGLVNDATLIDQSAQAMLDAYTSGDTKSVRSNAEAIINLIVGKQDSELYKDWDSDGKINDPGDGYGLLLNGDQAGYVGGAIDHAQLAAESSDSTAGIRMHSGHVIICAQNVEDWATQLRDIAIRVVQSESNEGVETDIRSAVTLADQMLNGIDINGNEIIDPIPGEGGAITAYKHAGYMSDMPILAGKNQIPATGQ